MRKNIQKSSIAKRLLSIAAYPLNSSPFRCVLVFLVVCFFVTLPLWGDFEDGVVAYKHGDYTTALRHLQPLAKQGYARAQFHLGFMYDAGHGVAQDDVEAVKWYRKAAEQGDAEAQELLGYMYEMGYGVHQDVIEAEKWYKKAVDQWEPLAEQGNVRAQFYLGCMYLYGEGVPENPIEAVKWLRKAAEQGDADAEHAALAQYNLGRTYSYYHEGIQKDLAEATKWYKKAVKQWGPLAEQGDLNAQTMLGYMYLSGGGVSEDYVKALKWLRKAAEQGYAEAQFYLATMYAEGRGVSEDYVEALKWDRRAAEQGHAEAQAVLGSVYEDGELVSKDYVSAYVWYTLATARGYDESSSRDRIAKQMTAAQIAEAKRRASNWKPVTPPSTSTQRQKPTTTPSAALPPILSFEDITLSERVLDAKETATLKIRIKNVGPGDARDLKLQLSEGLTGLTFPKTIDVPTIPKDGGEKTVNVSIRGGLNLPTATVAIDIHLNEPHFKQRIQGKRLTFSTRAFRNPELTMADAAISENRSAAPNSRIDLNEMIDLKFYVQNRGVGTAEQIKIQVSNNQKGVMWLGVADTTGLKKTAPTFTKIDAGKFELVTYTYFVNSEFTDDELRFDIQATEEHGKYGFSETKTVAIDTQLKQLGVVKTLDINDEEEPGTSTVTIEDVPALEIDVRKDIPETPAKNPNAVAVVIGNKDYTNPSVPDVAYADKDALIVKQYLINTLGYSEENIHYHVNATKGVFEEVFGNEATHKGRLFDYVEADGSSDVFIYYSGHGAPDIESKQPYLVPTDANPSTVKVGGYALKQLYLNLNKVPYRSATVVIDSCFSGKSASGELIPGVKGYGIPQVEISLLPREKSVIFTATNEHQVANGYSDKQHSLFTYFFLKALRGEADESGDNQLTVNEISAYIDKHVPRISRRVHGSSREQTPQVIGNKKLVIVNYR